MKVYLVGGAVRDQALGLLVKEKDWVVVGANPETLKNLGYRQVGSDFPVFLHPETREEYALARTERKSAPGYYGFHCDFGEQVTLEADLSRRDLTINAMAMDEQGHIIDPFNGLADLHNKCLRHVSPAFVEDPVRVLRVARFAARYHHLGFVLAEETRRLMYDMAKKDELAYLVAERVWQEWSKSLSEKNPELFIQTLRSCGALRIILPELDALFGVPNSAHYHPEIDSGVHTLMVLQAACGMTDNPVIRFAALMHDLGKALTPVQYWPKHHGHEERGIKPIEQLCQRLRVPTEYRQLALLTSTLHLNIHRLFELRPDTIVRIMEEADAFRRPQQFYNLLIACEADAKGVGGTPKPYEQSTVWTILFNLCQSISPDNLIAQGYTGTAIKKGLHDLRIEAVKTWLKQRKTHEK